MKKALLIIITMFVMVASTCNKQAGPSAEMVLKSSTSTAITISYNIKKNGVCSVTVTETCSAGCDTLTPAMKVGGTLKWNVTFDGFDPVKETPQATIDNFQNVSIVGGVYSTSPVNPFSSAASFSFDSANREKSANAARVGTYKYSVTVKWNDGGTTVVTNVFDPRVIFDM